MSDARPPAQGKWWMFDLHLILICAGAIFAAFWLTPGAERVAIYGVEIPEICGVKNLTGWSCPGCGLTRSWTYLVRGDLWTSLQMNWLGPIFFLAAVLQIPLSTYRIWRGSRARASRSPKCPS